MTHQIPSHGNTDDPVSLNPVAGDDRSEGDAQPNLVRNRSEGLPIRVRRSLQRAGQFIEKHRPDDADRVLGEIPAPNSQHPEVLRMLGVVRHLQGRHSESIALLRNASERLPGDALIHNNLGSALRGTGDLQAAEAVFHRACELNPNVAAVWFNLGLTYTAQIEIGKAAEAYSRALACDPHHLRARMEHASSLVALGQVDTVIAEYRNVVARDPGNVQAWSGLANINTMRFTAEDTAALDRLANSADLAAQEQTLIRFALARALEDQGRYDEAFTVLNIANSTMRRQVEWDAAGFAASNEAIMAAFAAPPKRSADAHLGREVIFIVSLPRSGSTLVEQILSSHSDVEGANELSDLNEVIHAESRRRGAELPQWVQEASAADWRRLGQEYLKRTERWRKTHPIFTDKALSNWRYIGAALAMLPGARFINCRRDPVETCLSCYRQRFAKGHGYAYDLTELAAYWTDYDRMMRFWIARYPHRVLDVVHEQLLADPDVEIHRMLDFCNLPFEPACMRFHENKRAVRTFSAAQVREPLRRSTTRAERYGDLLAPLRWVLGVESITPY